MPTQMTRHVVVDGSNLATEGRPFPSLKQLNEAVMAYMEDNPSDIITVVVDATFGHRIDPAEVDEFDDAVDNNELVAPPAGAIGRGDAFVLTIANKAGAMILSNDSFQEFHGDHPWLFDEGRLVGGKPVPNVGWVFVPRTPVRGPVSRRAQRDARQPGRTARAGELRKGQGRPSKLASEPLPVPKTPPPGAARRPAEPVPAASAPASGPAPAGDGPAVRPLPGRNEPINELVAFLEFVERHPVGSPITAEVEQFSSHGAYLDADGVRAYIPLRFMGDPAPRSARSVLGQGERREFVVVSYNASRRGIDVAFPEAVPGDVAVREEPEQPEALPEDVVAAATEADRPKRRRGRRTEPEPEAPPSEDLVVGTEVDVEVDVEPEPQVAAEEPAPRRERSRRRAARPSGEPEVEASPAPDVAAPEPIPELATSAEAETETIALEAEADTGRLDAEPVAVPTAPGRASRRRRSAATEATAKRPSADDAPRARRRSRAAEPVDAEVPLPIDVPVEVEEAPAPAKRTRRRASADADPAEPDVAPPAKKRAPRKQKAAAPAADAPPRPQIGADEGAPVDESAPAAKKRASRATKKQPAATAEVGGEGDQ